LIDDDDVEASECFSESLVGGDLIVLKNKNDFYKNLT
jgi:hypothetical protein